MHQKAKTKLNILIHSIMFCVLAFLLMMIYIPKLMGYQTYYIRTDSMSPTIPKNSLVLSKKIAFEDIRVNDILTFQNDLGNDYFTHRVVAIDADNQMLTTRGDANQENDPAPTSYYFVVGKVDFPVPYIGAFVKILCSTAGKIVIASIYIAWIAVEIELFVMKRKAQAGGLQ